MRVMLVDPPQFQVNPLISNARLPSSGLLALNTYLHPLGHEVCYVDCKNSSLHHDDVSDLVRDFRPDVVGVTAFSLDIYSALMVCELTKKISPEAICVLGGYHASGAPELTLLTCPQLDICAIGESELTFSELLALLGNGSSWSSRDLERIPGLAFRDESGRICRSARRTLLPDLDSLPMTHWGNLEIDHYDFPLTTATLKRRVGVGFSFSRGCWHDCKYCSNNGMWNRKWRTFSPERILKEIRQLHDVYGKTNFFFYDNDFLMDRAHAKRFLDCLEQSGLSIQWAFETSTANIIKCADLFPRMHDLGHYMCMVGFEFASPVRMKSMDKVSGSIERSRKAAQILRDAGALIFALGIIGFPDETEESIREHVRFFHSLRPDLVYTQCLTPLPGSRLFTEFHTQGRIATYDFSKYDLMTPTLKYDHATMDDIADWHSKAAELLFTPLCLDLYTEYRRQEISLDELTDRYAHVSNAVLEYNRGQVKLEQTFRAYSESVIDRNEVPDRPIPAGNNRKVSKKRGKAFRKRLEWLDEQWSEMMGEDFRPLDDEEQKLVLQQMTRKLPVDELGKVLRQKITRVKLMELWVGFMSEPENRAQVRREVKARRKWRKKCDQYVVEQSNHLQSVTTDIEHVARPKGVDRVAGHAGT